MTLPSEVSQVMSEPEYRLQLDASSLSVGLPLELSVQFDMRKHILQSNPELLERRKALAQSAFVRWATENHHSVVCKNTFVPVHPILSVCWSRAIHAQTRFLVQCFYCMVLFVQEQMLCYGHATNVPGTMSSSIAVTWLLQLGSLHREWWGL